MARLSELLVSVRDAAARFEPDRWSGDDCARLAEELARAAKAGAVGVGAGVGTGGGKGGGVRPW